MVAERVAGRDGSLKALDFPYGAFRTHQHSLARRIYRAWRDEENLLVDAPTGSGKTMAAAFPALKAMGEGEVDRLVVLTSRTTGQGAFEQAFADLTDAGADIAAVTVTAKARICFNPELPCDPDLCEYARGYFDRMPEARDELLARGVATRAMVEEVARAHRVCPFELSVDTAAWSDAIVGDCNYVFDPVVRLARLQTPTFPQVAVLVDEAHRLGERVRDMLSATLSRGVVKEALRECSSEDVAIEFTGPNCPPPKKPSAFSTPPGGGSDARAPFPVTRNGGAGYFPITPPSGGSRKSRRLFRRGVGPATEHDRPNPNTASNALAPGLRSVDRALASLARSTFGPAKGRRDGEREIEPPTALLRAIERLLSDGLHGGELPHGGAAQEAWFDLSRLRMASEWAASASEEGQGTDFAWVARWQDRNLEVDLVCAAPGAHIRSRLGEFHGSVRMSGSFRPHPRIRRCRASAMKLRRWACPGRRMVLASSRWRTFPPTTATGSGPCLRLRTSFAMSRKRTPALSRGLPVLRLRRAGTRGICPPRGPGCDGSLPTTLDGLGRTRRLH